MPTTPGLDPAFLTRLDALRLSVRHVRWGQWMGGRYLINRRGSSIEFADYLPYAPGDDIRSIDWNLYARLDRLFVKTYKEEIALEVEILVDATRSMRLPSPAKFERARRIGLALAYIALGGKHRVRWTWIRPGGVRESRWLTHRGEITQLGEQAYRAQPDGHVALGEWLTQALPALRFRGGQAIVLSDWMYRAADGYRALHVLLRQHMDVKLIQVVTPQELDPATFMRGGMVVDSETGDTHELAYAPAELSRAVREHNERLARFAKRNGVLFAQHRTDEPLEPFLMRTLPSRGFLE